MMNRKRSKRISGTREWSVASANCVLGCPHRCRYCYARADAVRRKQCPSATAWGTTYHRLREPEVRKPRHRVGGTVMFPTTHDITPDFLEPCLTVIGKILAAGNRLLIVSKPWPECIIAIVDRFKAFREQILFRFSIGAKSAAILHYWEPGAPPFWFREASLKEARCRGFATSVSCEPLLDAENVVELVEQLSPFVTDSIWIGKLNGIGHRLGALTDPDEVRRIKAGQTDEKVREIYRVLKDHPLIRWKESYKDVIGLELADEAGSDR